MRPTLSIDGSACAILRSSRFAIRDLRRCGRSMYQARPPPPPPSSRAAPTRARPSFCCARDHDGRSVQATCWPLPSRNGGRRPVTVAVAGALMFGATMAEIFTPVAIGRLVDALGSAARRSRRRGPGVRGRPRPRHPVPAAAEVRRLSSGPGSRLASCAGSAPMPSPTCSASPATGTPTPSPARPCATSRAGCGRSTCFGDAVYFHLGPSVAITVGAVGADDLALAADGAGLPGRRPPLHGGLGPAVAGLRGAAPPRRRRNRQPRSAGRWPMR